MFTLSEVEKQALLNSTDPAVVASTKKLIAAEEAGEFVPKSRLNQVLTDAKTATDELARINAEKKQKEDDEAKKRGEYEKLLEAEKAAHVADLEKAKADEADAKELRAAKKAAVEEIRKKMGNRWDDSFIALPLEALAKIAGEPISILNTSAPAPKPNDEGITNNPFSKKTLNIAEQVRIKKTNPALAEKLLALAVKE